MLYYGAEEKSYMLSLCELFGRTFCALLDNRPATHFYDLRLLSHTISRMRSRTIASKINAPKEFAKYGLALISIKP